MLRVSNSTRTGASSTVNHPFEYQIQQAVQDDWLRAAAQRRLVAEAARSMPERPRPAHVLRAAAACLHWPAVLARLVKLDNPYARGSV
jgi:hypothetical protein